MNWFEPTDEHRSNWATWVAERPQTIRDLIVKYDFAPWKLYRLKTSNHRVTIHSFDENKSGPPTLKIHVTGEFNAVAFERTVFNIKPEDLEECDLPKPGEPLGSMNMSIEDVKKIMANRPS